jgi:hypothetical protein
MSDKNESEKDEWDLYELVKLGDDYRKDYSLTVFGKNTSVTIRPLIDEESIPYSVRLQDKFGAEDRDEALEEAEDYVKEAKDDEGAINMSEVDDEFINIMKEVYDDGVCPEKTWPDKSPEEAKKRANFVKNRSMGGAVIDIAMEILDLSGTMEDALKFPGRGSQ